MDRHEAFAKAVSALQKKRDRETSVPSAQAPVEDRVASPLVGTGEGLAALRALSSDMHDHSMRPCETCRRISTIMREPFGCYAYQARRGQPTDFAGAKSAANAEVTGLSERTKERSD
jgi:hypothetical protein